jgi:hypothetical protein
MLNSYEKSSNDTLIALMNNKKDFLIAQNEHWYRIPVSNAPSIIKNNQAKYLTFFHTKVFSKWKHSIMFYAEIKQIQKVPRSSLFPNELNNKKHEKWYYKIEFKSLKQLEKPIVSQIPRRWLFVPTTILKLLNRLSAKKLITF